MEYSISLAPEGDHVLVEVVGDVTREEVLRIQVEASKFGGDRGVDLYLEDFVQSRNVESPFENYGFAHEDLPAAPVRMTARVACLVDPEDHSHDFAETAMVNMGFPIRLFTDRAQALSWLRS